MDSRIVPEEKKAESAQAGARHHSVLTWLPGVLLTLLAIAVLLRVVNWKGVVQAWATARPWVIVPGLLLMVLAQLSRAIGWRYLVDRKVSVSRSFSVLNVGYLLNSLLPFRLGDLGRAVLGGLPGRGNSNLSVSAALSAVVVERVTDVLITGLIGVAALAFFATGSWAGHALEITLVLAVLGIVALFALAVARTGIVGAARKWLGRVSWLEPWVVRLDEFLAGIQVVGRWSVMAPAAAGIAGAWLAWLLEYWVILQGFVPGAGANLALASLAGGALGVMIPSSPNSLGVYEAAVVAVLVVAGMSSGTSLAFALSIHLLNTIGVLALGAWGLVREGQTLGQLVPTVMEIRGRTRSGEASRLPGPSDRRGQG